MKIKENFKRFVTGTLCLTTFAMYQPILPAYAEQESKEFKYTMFASSNDEGAITVNASNFTINGQIATNGTVNCTGNTNIDYKCSNNVCVDMLYIPNKIDNDFFSDVSVDYVEDDYSIEETNIDISTPLSVDGVTTMQGNVTIEAGVKSKDDIYISGDVKNSYSTVVYSQYGDININCNNVSLNGLIYAPFGTVSITATNLNMNDTMIIANKIVIYAPNVNVNYSEHFGSYFNEVSDKMEIPEDDFGYLKDLNGDGIPDFFENSINWKYIEDTDGDGVPDIIEINTGTDPNTPDSNLKDMVDGITLEMMYKNPLVILDSETGKPRVYGDINEDLILDAFDLVLMRQLYLNGGYDKYADLDADGDLDADDLVWLESYLLLRVKSFPVYANFDSDGDGLSDYVEVENYGTSLHKADTDGDGLNDYFEVLLMKTNPLEPDNISGEDPDNDGLTNAQESKYNTNPYSEDTDEDGLTDWQEIMALGTDPLSSDTDNDGLTDYDEVNVLGTNPNNPKTDGTPDGKRIFNQTIAEDDPLLSKVNTVDNAYALSIDIEASGNAKRLLNVEKSGYTNVMKDGSAVGFIPEFSYPDSYNVNSITLNFRIKDEYKSSVMDIFAGDSYNSDGNDDISGINRFMVFKYFEEIDMQMPIEKVCEINGDTVSVKLPKESFELDNKGYSVHNIGSYALVDLEVWGMMMNNNLMPDEVVEAYIPEDDSVSEPSLVSEENNINESSITSENGIDTQSLAFNVAFGPSVRTINILNNYSKIGYSNSSKNNNFDTKVVGGHVYAVISSDLGWNDAKKACENMKGHLMTINNATEFGNLQYSLTSGNTKNCYWIGATGSGRSWSLVNKEGVAEYLNKLEVKIDNEKYHIGHFSSACGKYLYYADGLSYYDGKNVNHNVVGYICEWDSYAAYLSYLKGDAIKGTGKETFSSFFGTFILDSTIDKLKDIDTDGDGISDYYELNWSVLHKVYDENTTNTKVSYVGINNCLSFSPVHGVLVSLYSGNSKSNKALNKTAVNTTIVGGTSIAYAATKEVVPMNDNITDPDLDRDYLVGNEDTNPNYTDPTPIDMQIIDDSDMFDVIHKIGLDDGGDTTVVQPRPLHEVIEYTVGGGKNELINMHNGNNKVATVYNRDDRFDFIEFLIHEDDKASCIIVEIEFVSDSAVTRNINYMDENFVRFYKSSDYRTSYILNKEKIISDNNKPAIKYTLGTCGISDYILNIDSRNIVNDITVKIYEETYVYAPDGGIAFKDKIYISRDVVDSNYRKIYINGKTFKELTSYDNYFSENANDWRIRNVNSRVADGIMCDFKNDSFDKYELKNKIFNFGANTATDVGFAALVLQGTSILGTVAVPAGKIVKIAGTVGNVATVSGAAFSADILHTIDKEDIEQDLKDTLNESIIKSCIPEGSAITEKYLLDTDMHQNSYLLNKALDDNNFNICLETYDPGTLLPNTHIDWDTWDGNYINRVRNHSILNVALDLELKYTDEIFN